jgi:phosphatidate cytidylyltransferase
MPNSTPVTELPKTTRMTFFLRLASTLVLWALVLGTIFSGFEIGFFVIIAGLGLTGLWEYFNMLEHMRLPAFRAFGMTCAAVFFVGSFYFFRTYGPGEAYEFELSVILMFLMATFARQMFARTRIVVSFETMAHTLFGLMYVVWMFNFVTKLVYVIPSDDPVHRVTGQFYVLYLVAVTKFSDMGAYLVGMLIGKHQVVPHISPKKTWEGFFGALAFSTLASCGLVALLPEQLGILTYVHAVILGLLLGFAAVIGDLAESIVKRSTGVKDSSQILPGIGGVLDLIDSLLFTAPLLFFYMRLVIGVAS